LSVDSTTGTELKRFLYVVAIMMIAACSREPAQAPPVSGPSTFAGGLECADCHQAEFDLWRGSHHQLAMQEANSETVLGDFSGISVPYYETDTVFTTRDGKYYVTTEDAAGELQEYEVTHTFGVMPLQQYLVEFPGGRKQALQFAWDSRPEDSGGQRWYHLYPDEYVGPGDVLHWTGRYFNWNYMCAECHSTNVALGYDIDSDSYTTTFDEVSVGCESCHGPGSRHIEQANAEAFDDSWGLDVDLDDHNGAAWIMNIDTGIAERSSPNTSTQQPESCGRCHARRSVAGKDYAYGTPLANTHILSLLDENLYHADGRIQEEVYVYGSFVQSKMYAAGVTCSDCHDPHSSQLRAGPDPNNTCATCHLPAKFATPEHSESSVGDCVSCHMPATTYMGVDDRRDHSFRLPGTSEAVDHYGAVIAAGRQGNANEELLKGIANAAFPPIARATMLTLLETVEGPEERRVLVQQLDDSDPLVRIGALRAMRQQSPELRIQYGSHLLIDPVRSVRIEAARNYVEYRDLLPLEAARAFAAAADEYREALMEGASLPEAAVNLAEFETQLGNTTAATKLYEHALRIGPDMGLVHHAFGLHLVRNGRSSEALGHLAQAADLAPEVPQFTYVYAVALNSLGDPDEALRLLSQARKEFPNDVEIGWALATMLRDAGELELARVLANELAGQFPGDPRLSALAQSLAGRPGR
jgi:tetratricopeptide (TPR) repeat protein